MKNGLYCVTFTIAGQSGAGVVVLRDGKLSGGDSGSYYLGEYTIDGDRFHATVNIRTHTKDPNMTYVFGDAGGEVTLNGTATEAAATTRATSPQLHGLTFDCHLRLIAD